MNEVLWRKLTFGDRDQLNYIKEINDLKKDLNTKWWLINNIKVSNKDLIADYRNLKRINDFVWLNNLKKIIIERREFYLNKFYNGTKSTEEKIEEKEKSYSLEETERMLNE